MDELISYGKFYAAPELREKEEFFFFKESVTLYGPDDRLALSVWNSVSEIEGLS